jgi:hypothetical protein
MFHGRYKHGCHIFFGRIIFYFDFDIDLTLDWTILFLKAIYTGTCHFR